MYVKYLYNIYQRGSFQEMCDEVMNERDRGWQEREKVRVREKYREREREREGWREKERRE